MCAPATIGGRASTSSLDAPGRKIGPGARSARRRLEGTPATSTAGEEEDEVDLPLLLVDIPWLSTIAPMPIRISISCLADACTTSPAVVVSLVTRATRSWGLQPELLVSETEPSQCGTSSTISRCSLDSAPPSVGSSDLGPSVPSTSTGTCASAVRRLAPCTADTNQKETLQRNKGSQSETALPYLSNIELGSSTSSYDAPMLLGQAGAVASLMAPVTDFGAFVEAPQLKGIIYD